MRLATLLLLLVCPLIEAAEPALQPVTVCEVLQDLSAYDGKVVAVVGRFSFRHDITGGHIWQFALVLMACSEVLSRIGVLQFRRIRAEDAPGSRPADRGGADNPRLVVRQAA